MMGVEKWDRVVSVVNDVNVVEEKKVAVPTLEVFDFHFGGCGNIAMCHMAG